MKDIPLAQSVGQSTLSVLLGFPDCKGGWTQGQASLEGMKNSYCVLSPALGMCNQAGSFQGGLEYLCLSTKRKRGEGKEMRRDAEIKVLVFNIPPHETTMFCPPSPHYIKHPLSHISGKGVLSFLSTHSQAFPRHPSSQHITHDSLPLLIISTLLISLGNPGWVVTASSFICFRNVIPECLRA